MTREELLARLKQDEDALVERKTSVRRSGVMETLVAFANSVEPGQEGVLFLGVRPDKMVVGVENADKLQQSVPAWARDECYRPVAVQCQVPDGLGPGSVLAVIVPASNQRPHFTGQACKRIGSKTVKASGEMFEELVASRNDKVRHMLKCRGQRITFVKYVAAFGRVQPIPDECEIEVCDAFSVRVRHVGSGAAESVPLELITISDDPEHHRQLKLIERPVVVP